MGCICSKRFKKSSVSQPSVSHKNLKANDRISSQNRFERNQIQNFRDIEVPEIIILEDNDDPNYIEPSPTTTIKEICPRRLEYYGNEHIELPLEFANISLEACDLLMASSIIGNSCMMPWSELDNDLKNNLWYQKEIPEDVVQLSDQHFQRQKLLALENVAVTQRTTPQNIVRSKYYTTIPSPTESKKWIDPEGYLSMSPHQASKFYKWVRMNEMHQNLQFTSPSIQQNTSALQQQYLRLQQHNFYYCIETFPSYKSIKQGFIGDCSFLSSLSVLAYYQEKFDVPIISDLLYPQVFDTEKKRFVPVYNPNGMHAVRLYVNGVARKVLVDDIIPIKKTKKNLLAHSSNIQEIWVTLMEKAFLKLMGCELFLQGSNPNNDLYHLTSWIPETIALKLEFEVKLGSVYHGSTLERIPPLPLSPLTPISPLQPTAIGAGQSYHTQSQKSDIVNRIGISPTTKIEFKVLQEYNNLWKILLENVTAGNCVLCLGTSDISDAVTETGLEYPEGVSLSSGIVAKHAYSVLRLAEYKGVRLLFVKNPWAIIRSHLRYSPSDTENWGRARDRGNGLRKGEWRVERLKHDASGSGSNDWRWGEGEKEGFGQGVNKETREEGRDRRGEIDIFDEEEREREKREKARLEEQMKDRGEIEAYLNYNVVEAREKDDGCFWITWEDVLTWFSHIYVSWVHANLFLFQEERHFTFQPNEAIKRSILSNDSYLVAHLPQFLISIDWESPREREDKATEVRRRSVKEREIWLLLSRHIGEVHQRNNINTNYQNVNQKYISLQIYNQSTGVYSFASPVIQGTYGNSECILLKFRLDENEVFMNPSSLLLSSSQLQNEKEERENLPKLNASQFVLVVSLYNMECPQSFTLKVLSNVKASMVQLPSLLDSLPYHQFFMGEWSKYNAGGSANNIFRYLCNPMYNLVVKEETTVALFLECDSDITINLRLVYSSFASPRLLKTSTVLSSGPYRNGCACVTTTLQAGTYTIIPSTFRFEEYGRYQLCVHASTSGVECFRIPQSYPYTPGSLEVAMGSLCLPWGGLVMGDGDGKNTVSLVMKVLVHVPTRLEGGRLVCGSVPMNYLTGDLEAFGQMRRGSQRPRVQTTAITRYHEPLERVDFDGRKGKNLGDRRLSVDVGKQGRGRDQGRKETRKGSNTGDGRGDVHMEEGRGGGFNEEGREWVDMESRWEELEDEDSFVGETKAVTALRLLLCQTDLSPRKEDEKKRGARRGSNPRISPRESVLGNSNQLMLEESPLDQKTLSLVTPSMKCYAMKPGMPDIPHSVNMRQREGRFNAEKNKKSIQTTNNLVNAPIHTLQLIKSSDMEGGLNEEKNQRSSAANILFQNNGLVTTTRLELSSLRSPYLIHVKLSMHQNLLNELLHQNLAIKLSVTSNIDNLYLEYLS